MKRCAVVVGAVVAMGAAMFVAIALRPWYVAIDEVSRASCDYHTQNCAYVVAFPAGHFRMAP
ncbi:Lipoprotein [Paraburkholderia sacchari]